MEDNFVCQENSGLALTKAHDATLCTCRALDPSNGDEDSEDEDDFLSSLLELHEIGEEFKRTKSGNTEHKINIYHTEIDLIRLEDFNTAKNICKV